MTLLYGRCTGLDIDRDTIAACAGIRYRFQQTRVNPAQVRARAGHKTDQIDGGRPGVAGPASALKADRRAQDPRRETRRLAAHLSAFDCASAWRCQNRHRLPQGQAMGHRQLHVRSKIERRKQSSGDTVTPESSGT